MLAVDDCVVMVSGANRGIGRALATGLLAKGYRLSVGARRPEALAGLGGEEAERVLAAAYDALEPASAQAWVEATRARFGRIDALINNAGALRHATVEDGRDDDFEYLWQVNAMGPLRLTDLVGLDVRLGIAEHLAAALGPRFEPPELLRTMVAEGKLGKKSGEGFYTWT